ncbi:YiiD C-terminal domain-containing protein [Alkalimarinus coralli]|nr:YiiD C-terminal domain-containing protein [Alkalimarinus coralli]
MNRLLKTHIPLCGFMELAIKSLESHSIIATAPIQPNRNMHGTGFAGAQYSLAVATGWALVQNRLDVAGMEGQLVVREATIHYKYPVTSDITLKAEFEVEMNDSELRSKMAEEGRINFPLTIAIYSEDKRCAYLNADYVVLGRA